MESNNQDEASDSGVEEGDSDLEARHSTHRPFKRRSQLLYCAKSIKKVTQNVKFHNDRLLRLLWESFNHANFNMAVKISSVLLQGQDAQRERIASQSVASTSANDPPTLREVDHESVADLFGVVTQVVKQLARSPEHLLRYLRHVMTAHPLPAGKERVSLEMAAVLLDKGDLDGAYDVLISAMPYGTRKPMEHVDHFTRDALCGLIRHSQWLAASEDYSNRQHALESQDVSALPAAPSFFPSLPALLPKTTAGRRCREMWRESMKHCKAALRHRPGTTVLALITCHMLCCAGKLTEARRLAALTRQVVPHDADAAFLHAATEALACVNSVAGAPDGNVFAPFVPELDGDTNTGAAGKDAAASSSPEPHRVVEALQAVLESDPTCAAAVTGLLHSSSHCPSCMVAAVKACFLYLDMCPDGDGGTTGPITSTTDGSKRLNGNETARKAWLYLANTLVSEGQQHVQESQMETGGSGGSEDKVKGAANGSVPGSVSLMRKNSWGSIVNELSCRSYWWPAIHFSIAELPRADLSKDSRSPQTSAPQTVPLALLVLEGSMAETTKDDLSEDVERAEPQMLPCDWTLVAAKASVAALMLSPFNSYSSFVVESLTRVLLNSNSDIETEMLDDAQQSGSFLEHLKEVRMASELALNLFQSSHCVHLPCVKPQQAWWKCFPVRLLGACREQ